MIIKSICNRNHIFYLMILFYNDMMAIPYTRMKLSVLFLECIK